MSTKIRKPIDCDLVRDLLDYRDGTLFWKKHTYKNKIGTPVSGKCSGGYVVVWINGGLYKAHRVIWVWHGFDLPQYLDHIDGDKTNNRIENLRETTNGLNQANSKVRADNTSGAKGIHFENRRKKWRAYVSINNKFKSLGYFFTKEEALSVRKKAAESAYGEFCKHE